MRKLVSFIIGIGVGMALGVGFVALFSPVSGEQFRQNLRNHYEQALATAREASARRRAELEAELNPDQQADD